MSCANIDFTECKKSPILIISLELRSLKNNIVSIQQLILNWIQSDNFFPFLNVLLPWGKEIRRKKIKKRSKYDLLLISLKIKQQIVKNRGEERSVLQKPISRNKNWKIIELQLEKKKMIRKINLMEIGIKMFYDSKIKKESVLFEIKS